MTAQQLEYDARERIELPFLAMILWRIPCTAICVSFVVLRSMLKIRIKRRADNGARTSYRLAQIELSIIALQNEDLLDFADIFKIQNKTPLAEIAAIELAKRDIKL